jgi:predicted O-linked N-acetylglucosamine transferase (SPINDLY family)
MDYIIADRTVIPEDHFACYSEKVVWLPDNFMVRDANGTGAERIPSRSELGLPDSGFVFCCFNQPYKITPPVFAAWMRLLQAIDGSVLWLKDNGAAVSHNLRREAEARGIGCDRLIFAPAVPRFSDHLARQRQADLFLDTVPYNAHATANDALAAGLPVLTCLGSTFAARVAASLLTAAGLAELIAASLADYEALALKLARDPNLLRAAKDTLSRQRETCALFDTRRFTRNIEAAYRKMADLQRRGATPASLAISAAE